MKNKVFSFINIIGLSFSVAFCLLLFFYIRHEQSYDSFHAGKDQLFRLEMTNIFNFENKQPDKKFFSFLTKNDDISYSIELPLVVAKDIQDAFRHLEWREARRRFVEIAEKYDLDEYGLPRRGTW